MKMHTMLAAFCPQLLVCSRCGCRCGALAQPRNNKRLQLAAKDALRVGGFHISAHVLYQLVGMQHIVANLLSPLRLDDVAPYAGDVRGALLFRDDQKFCL